MVDGVGSSDHFIDHGRRNLSLTWAFLKRAGGYYRWIKLSVDVGFTNIAGSVDSEYFFLSHRSHNGMYNKQYHNNLTIMADVVAPDSGYSTLRKHTENRLSCAVELWNVAPYMFVVESSTRARNRLNVWLGVSTCIVATLCGVLVREPNKRRISEWNIS